MKIDDDQYVFKESLSTNENCSINIYSYYDENFEIRMSWCQRFSKDIISVKKYIVKISKRKMDHLLSDDMIFDLSDPLRSDIWWFVKLLMHFCICIIIEFEYHLNYLITFNSKVFQCRSIIYILYMSLSYLVHSINIHLPIHTLYHDSCFSRLPFISCIEPSFVMMIFVSSL